MKNGPIAVYTDLDELDITPGRRLLEENGWTVRVLGTSDPVRIAEGAQDADVLMVGYAQISAETIAALPKVKLIALLSMGFNNVDLKAAEQSGVWVSNVPGSATQEVAEHALALAIAVSRRTHQFHNDVRSGQWSLLSSPLPKVLRKTSVGLLGFGRIGRAFAGMAAHLFGEVTVYDPFVTELTVEEAAAGIQLASMEEVLTTSDVLSLHLPLNEDTRHLVNEAAISRMRKGAVIVNVSRGELIDESALLRALESGKISGAGLDVLTEEPPSADHPLITRPEVIVTPHTGFLSEHTATEYPLVQARNALAWAQDGRPASSVNSPQF